MGSAASLAGESAVTIDKAKELAGDKWSPELESKFTTLIADKSSITLGDIRRLVPDLFEDTPLSLEMAKASAAAAGVAWNEMLEAIFTENMASDSQSINLSIWKALVPSLFETPEERTARIEAEFQVVLAARADGTVVVNYQMYNEEFPISGNTLTAARIDEDYGLTDVMPGCRIRLSAIQPTARTNYANAHDGAEAPYCTENPQGTFRELLAGETYYCIVIENPAQYEKDMVELQKRLAAVGPVADEKKSRAQEV